MRTLLGLAALGCLATPALAANLHVPAQFPTIQAAINSSTTGDVVVIAPGTYVERLVMLPQHSGVSLHSSGGAAATIVDAAGAGTTLSMHSVGGVTEVRGLTLRGGTGTVGGGINLQFSSPRIEDCIIESNVANAAGGVYSNYSSPTLVRCIIRGNWGRFGSGGGVYADHSGTTRLENCIVYDNTAAGYGGGVTAWETARVLLTGCTIANNSALHGGNLYLTRGGSFDVVRTIVAFAPSGQNIVAITDPGTLTFSCSNLWITGGGTGIEGASSPLGSAGNFSLDPGFCDIGAGQFGLLPTSPCASSANTGGCGLIGARDVECGVVHTEKRSWGDLKSRYR